MSESRETLSSGNKIWDSDRHSKVKFSKVPLGAWILSRIGLFNFYPSLSYRVYVLVLTFCCYAAYHMSRKPFSVVAHVLAPNCSFSPHRSGNGSNTSYDDSDDGYYDGYYDGRRGIYHHVAVNPGDYYDGWPPFNGTRCRTIIGAVDYAWLFTYAIFMVGSGLIADRVNLRYFLTFGMIGSGIFVGLLGVAYYAEIHYISYFIVVQIFVGIFESTGWPGVVSVMGNWLGISRRGLVMGVWNAHTSVGNILGTAIPAIWAVRGGNWSWAFLVPAFVMIFVAFIMYFFLIVDPSHVGLPPPQHHIDSNPIESGDSVGEKATPTPILKRFRNSLTGSQKYRDDDDTRPLVGDSPISSPDITKDQSFTLERRTPSPRFSPKKSLMKDGFNNHDEETKLISESSFTTDEHAFPHNGHPEPPPPVPKKTAIGLVGALTVPGVIEFSLALFFAKLVAYTFLFWLPYYITYEKIEGRYLGETRSNLLATLYDVGGIVGGIITGGLSDVIGARAISCVIMMYLAVPTLFMYRYLGPESLGLTIFLIIMCGLFINGPYALITTAVSSDLGTHKSLKENQRAKATVGAIIDGMGSMGAACGPLIAGWVSDDFGWNSVFYVLMFSCFMSSLMLSRLLFAELRRFYIKYKSRHHRQYGSDSKMFK